MDNHLYYRADVQALSEGGVSAVQSMQRKWELQRIKNFIFWQVCNCNCSKGAQLAK